MDKKKSKYKDEYSLRTLVYYQRVGGIYNDLITILQRIRNERPSLPEFPSPNKILNIVSEAYDAIIDICSDDEGHIHSFTEENIVSYLESFSDILYGSAFSPIPGFFTNHSHFLQQVDLCVLASLMSQTPELKDIIGYIIEPVEKENPNLYTQFVLLIESKAEVTTQLDYLKRELQSKEQMIKLKDLEIKDKDSQIKQLTELKEVLSITVDRYKNDEIRRSNFDRILNLDTILKFAEGRKSYKRAAPILNMLTRLSFNTATEEEYQKIVSTEDKLLEINETEVAIFNDNKAFGSNLFTGIVNSPYFPMGVEEATIMKGLLPIVEDYFKRTYGDGTRRDNKD